MTHDELEEIRMSAESATPGPWKFYKEDDWFSVEFPGNNYAVWFSGATEDDAKFIARARQCVPRMLEFIKHLLFVGGLKDEKEKHVEEKLKLLGLISKEQAMKELEMSVDELQNAQCSSDHMGEK